MLRERTPIWFALRLHEQLQTPAIIIYAEQHARRRPIVACEIGESMAERAVHFIRAYQFRLDAARERIELEA
jgi:hypothetical protein